MKTTILSIALILFQIVTKAQNESVYTQSHYDIQTTEHIDRSELGINYNTLRPVYFNHRKRLLKYNGVKRMNEVEFLNLCRSIKDSAVQQQIARYDGFTKDQERLGLIALGSGFTAIGTLGTAAGISGQGNDMATATLAFCGVVSVLMIPICAIYSSVPHQKRKTVLFRDLPIAYNQYVESLNN